MAEVSSIMMLAVRDACASSLKQQQQQLAADQAKFTVWAIKVEGIPGTMTCQELESMVQGSLDTEFEILPHSLNLVSVMLCSSWALIAFSSLVLAEFFVRGHCNFSFSTMERAYSLDDEATVVEAMRKLCESGKVVHVYGAAEGADIFQVAEGLMEDVRPSLAQPTIVNWKRDLPGSRSCYLELSCDLVADLFCYRCSLQNLTVFRRRAFIKVALVPQEAAPPAQTQPEQAPVDMELAKESSTSQSQSGVVSKEERAEVDRPEQRTLFVTTEPADVPAEKLASLFHRAISKVRPGLKAGFEFTGSDVSKVVKFQTEREADLLMRAYVAFTKELFNEPAVGIYRHFSYVRQGAKRYPAGEADSRLIISGFPPELHNIPLKCALSEAIQSSLPGTILKMRYFCVKGNHVDVTVSAATADGILSLKKPLKISGCKLVVAERPRHRHEEPFRHRGVEQRRRHSPYDRHGSGSGEPYRGHEYHGSRRYYDDQQSWTERPRQVFMWPQPPVFNYFPCPPMDYSAPFH